MYKIGRTRLYLVIIGTILLESTFLNLISIDNIRPNLMLILIIFVALHSDWRGALETGIVGGLLRGVMTSGPVFINLVIFGLSGLFANRFKNKVYKESLLTQILLPLFIALGISILNLFIKIIINNVELVGPNIWHNFIFTALSLSIYTSLFSPPAFFCLNRLFRVKEPGF